MKDFACSIIAFVIGGIIVLGIKSTIFEFKKSRINEKELIELANEVNKKLPITINKETRWDSILAGPGKRLTYFYTLTNYSSSKIDSMELKKNMSPFLIKRACTNKGTLYYLKRGVYVSATYRGKDGGFIFTIDISPSDCGY